MLPALCAGHPGSKQLIILFFNCADSFPFTPVKYTSYVTGQARRGLLGTCRQRIDYYHGFSRELGDVKGAVCTYEVDRLRA